MVKGWHSVEVEDNGWCPSVPVCHMTYCSLWAALGFGEMRQNWIFLQAKLLIEFFFKSCFYLKI